mgnify:CR=1 FL=1
MTISFKTVITGVAAAALVFVASAVLPAGTSAVTITPPRCIFNTIVQPHNNGGTTLSWRVTGARNVHLNGVGDVDDSAALVVFPNEITTYTITATGNGGITTCSAVAHPVSSFSGNPYTFGFGNVPINTNRVCAVQASPDFVVPGGTAVLSWTAAGAMNAFIDNGIGNVGTSGARVVPAPVVPLNYTLTAEYSDGTNRSCTTTVNPFVGGAVGAVGGGQAPGAFVLQTPGVTLQGQQPSQVGQPVQPLQLGQLGQPVAVQTASTVFPNVNVTPTPIAGPVTSVSLNQVPYTGPEDVLYVLAMLLVAVGAGLVLFRNRRIVLA